MIGSRSPEKLSDFVSANNDTISTGSFAQTTQFGDIVVLATHGEATENAIDLSDPRNFEGKIVIDTSNPLDMSKGMPPTILRKYAEVSFGEYVQRKLQYSYVVKCFNTVPNALMFQPRFEGSDMLICENDKNAKVEIIKILKQLGWSGAPWI